MAERDDELPALPATADPFRLLGLDRTSTDLKAARRAYARLIKAYRPDRAPTEFARIHAAFEQVKARIDCGGPVLEPPEAPLKIREPDRPAGTAPQQSPQQPPRAPPPSPAEPHVGGEPEAPVRTPHVVEHLLDEPDALRARLDQYLVDEDLEGLREALDVAALADRARCVPEVADVCLGAVVALAWRGRAVEELVWTYSQGLSETGSGCTIDRVELALRTARSIRDSRLELPGAVSELMQDAAIATPDRMQALRKRAHGQVIDRWPTVFGLLDRLSPDQADALELLASWFSSNAERPIPVLAELSPYGFRELARLLQSGGRRKRLHPLNWWRYLLIYPPLFVLMGLVSVLYRAVEPLTVRHAYRRWGRRQLAEVMVITGLTAEVIRDWIRAKAKFVPRYRYFAPHVARDRPLRTLGYLVWYVHPRQLGPTDMSMLN